MIAFLLPLLARYGVAERLRKPLAYAGLVLLVIALCGLLWAAIGHFTAKHDERVVQIHDQDATIEAANRVINATREADANQMARDEAARQQDKELQLEAQKSTTDNVGPGVSGVLSKLRQQQNAASTHRNATR